MNWRNIKLLIRKDLRMSGRHSMLKRLKYMLFAWAMALPIFAIVGFNMHTLTLSIIATMVPYLKSYVLMFSALASANFVADMFAGEKERKTIESYLALPCAEHEIMLAKILVPMFFGTLAPILFLTPTTITIDIGFLLTQGLTVFDTGWYLTLFVLSRFKAASNFTGFTTIPFILLLFGTIYFPGLWNLGFILILISLCGVVDLGLYLGIRNGFDRERLILDLD